jgi:hypothetical protein
MKKMVCVLGIVVAAVASASAQENFPKDSAATIDAIPFETRTISDLSSTIVQSVFCAFGRNIGCDGSAVMS